MTTILGGWAGPHRPGVLYIYFTINCKRIQSGEEEEDEGGNTHENNRNEV